MAAGSSLVYEVSYRPIGYGGYGFVHEAIEIPSRKVVAIKKSRVPGHVNRLPRGFELWVLRLLQGHPAIPAMYAYGRLPHFDYMAMELLGKDLNVECNKMAEEGGTPLVKTSVHVTEQMLPALKYKLSTDSCSAS
ncbi:hypothetical protein AGABI1DRAFT_130561 [Agaricus bisporus var. burnettii JB137-S8]|uniref:Protein kinase domain-containing protein n=1 Tax=Agaricus bisporus var. burnettii (strain JB137-S8 / ATCC MYA-4627 / FGSC 10392) TaxID=597362 RepID=K5X2M3_AGABU|nr:uncharacterized protein AGABI1DRAFT_130561 [Agaricus bisporus var. burnettii JB137-S8]EKM77142.1 hypothetical protein AGABI1DRAFT_130561 [Agaricus bisporus var. burnettii JB137-S8]